jgi:uncharacterized membrane protein YjdF
MDRFVPYKQKRVFFAANDTLFASRLRLVMPPVLFAALSFPFTRLAYLLFPTWMANGIISGSFTFYVLYDTMHYGEPAASLSYLPSGVY